MAMTYSKTTEKTINEIKRLFRLESDCSLGDILQSLEVTLQLAKATSTEDEGFSLDCLAALNELKSK